MKKAVDLLWITLAVSISYFLSAKLVSPLSLSESSSIFAIWPPTGVALIFLLYKGRVVIPGVFLGAFMLNATISSPLVAFEIAIGNTLGPYTVYILVKRFLHEDILYDTNSVISFISYSAIGSIITSGMGTYALHLNGLLPSEHRALGWLVWLFGDLIGFLLLTSLYISFKLDRQYNKSLKDSIVEIAVMLVILSFTAMIIFGSHFFFEEHYPIEYLILFPLLWATARFKPGINLIFLFMITVMAIIGTASGYSNFSMEDKKVSLALLQFFIFTVTFAVLLMTAQKQQMQRVLFEKEQLTLVDALTQIGNRRCISEIISREQSIHGRYHRPISLILFDIDYFKSINDRFGHDKGDDVLLELVNVVKNIIRNSDHFARWGGEEFMIILPETSLEHAAAVAEKIRAAVESHSFDVPATITCSFGVIDLGEEEPYINVFKRADKKLYDAKNSGRNRVAT
jgi:diguanylate cyclase (GGDEF)-like protein